MKAIEIPAPGPPDVLRLVDRPDPSPGPGEVLIDVVAAGVNRPDLMQRQGNYPPPKGTTDIPGLEVAGRIVAIGPSLDGVVPSSASGRPWRTADEVCALVAGGGYAELCAAPGVQCLPVPRSLTLVEAAAVPETYFTVWTNLFDSRPAGPRRMGCSSTAARAASDPQPSSWPTRWAPSSSPRRGATRNARRRPGLARGSRSTTGRPISWWA